MKKMSRFFILFLACVFIFVGCDKKDDELVSDKSKSVQEENNNATNEGTNNESNDEYMNDPDKIGRKDLKISKIEPVGEIKKSESSDTRWQTVKFTVKNKGKRTLSFNITPYATKKIDNYGELAEIKNPVKLSIGQDHECLEHGSEMLPQFFKTHGYYSIGLSSPWKMKIYRITTVTYLEPKEERTYYANITFLADPNEPKSRNVEYKDFVLEANCFYLTKEDAEKNFYVHVSKKGEFSQKLVNWDSSNSLVAEYEIKNNTDKYIKEVHFIGEDLLANKNDYIKLNGYRFQNFKPGEEKRIKTKLHVNSERKGVAPELKDISAYVVDPEK